MSYQTREYVNKAASGYHGKYGKAYDAYTGMSYEQSLVDACPCNSFDYPSNEHNERVGDQKENYCSSTIEPYVRSLNASAPVIVPAFGSLGTGMRAGGVVATESGYAPMSRAYDAYGTSGGVC